MKEITLSASTLADLIDRLPNPEGPEPIGPGGPVIRWLNCVGLNPQPLPPRVTTFVQAVDYFVAATREDLRSDRLKPEWCVYYVAGVAWSYVGARSAELVLTFARLADSPVEPSPTARLGAVLVALQR